jgi:hypothetical protein
MIIGGPATRFFAEQGGKPCTFAILTVFGGSERDYPLFYRTKPLFDVTAGFNQSGLTSSDLCGRPN